MNKTSEKNKKFAYITIIIVSVLVWLVPVYFLVYLWLVLSAGPGTITVNFWITNGVATASNTVLPAVAAGLIYQKLSGSSLVRLAYAALAALGVALVGVFIQTLLMLVQHTVPPSYYLLPSLGGILLPQILTTVVVLAVTFFIITSLKKLINDNKKQQWIRRFVVAAAASCFGIMVINTLALMAIQYPSNPNMSGFQISLFGYGVIALAFAIFWVFERLRKSGEPFVVSSLATLLGFFLLSAVFSIGGTYRVDVFSLSSPLSLAGTAVGLLALVLVFGWIYRVIRKL